MQNTSHGMDELNAIRYSPFHRLVYIKNQKAGCTSIEYSLWKDKDQKTGQKTFRGRVHDKRSPILGGAGDLLRKDVETMRKLEVFSIVRNPFSRVLSVYLHHVFDATVTSRLTRRLGLWRSEEIRRIFYDAIGLSPKRSLSFQEFVERLVEASPERLTGHFRPQVVNLLWGRLHYDFIGRLEDSDQLSAYFSGHGIDLKKRAHHAQRAAQKIDQYYNARTVELVAARFSQDFQAFGYDTQDPTSALLQQPPSPRGGQTLRKLLAEAGSD